MVARVFQRIPLPGLVTHTQPKGKTLVNFDTILYTDAKPLDRTITLLGQRIDLAIRPSSFRWVHGDGTSQITSTPGAPYPAMEVLHRYQHAHVTVAVHVEVTWSATYRLNAGASQAVAGTVTTVGPPTDLRIAEATPVLSGAGH
jgi:hypothetical protein